MSNSKIEVIMRQTDYTLEQATEKLAKFNDDEMEVIRDYLGVKPKTNKKPVSSVNQAIYQQIRGHLDGAMREYRERADKGEAKKIL